MAETENPWHLDKRVPLALIVTILVQTGGAFWWASSVDNRVAVLERGDSRVTVLERDVERNRITNDAQTSSIRGIENGAIRTEQKVENALKILEEIKDSVLRLEGKR